MHLLLIDDDEELCRSLSYKLKKEGIRTDVCHDGKEGLALARANAHDLILLDRMLPSISGTKLLLRLREAGISTPVILITALGEIQERVEGLDCGADDYIVKPIAFEELMARIRSITRRPRQWEPASEIHCHDLSFDCQSKVLKSGENSCCLSKREGDLLEVFLKNPGRILPRMIILTKVWGVDAEIEDGNLDNYIHFLRRRLRTVHSTLSIKTIRGVGYCLEVPCLEDCT